MLHNLQFFLMLEEKRRVYWKDYTILRKSLWIIVLYSRSLSFNDDKSRKLSILWLGEVTGETLILKENDKENWETVRDYSWEIVQIVRKLCFSSDIKVESNYFEN